MTAILSSLLFAAALGAAGSVSAAATVKILLSLDASGRPYIQYTAPPESRRIDFADVDPRTHSLVRSRFWELDAACATLRPDGIALGDEKSCRSITVKLGWDGGTQDRFYPPLIALENGGVLVFTQYLQVDTTQGNSRWEVVAPPGGVALFRDRISRERLEFSSAALPANAQGWIYLGPDDFDRWPSVNLVIDRGLPPDISAEVRRVVPRLLTFLGEALGHNLKDVPSLFVTWHHRTLPGAFVQGDVAPGGVVRLSLLGTEWGAPDSTTIRRLRELVAHELIHLWNAGPFRFRSKGPPWLHEGNAELLSVAALSALRLAGTDETSERINVALNQCLILVATNRVLGFAMDRGPAPYHCGLIIQFTLLALWQKDHPGATPFSFWREFWRVHPDYDVDSFIRYVTTHSKSVRRLPAGFPEAAFEDRGNAIREALGIATMGIGRMEKLPDSLRQTIAMHAFGVAMRADCDGKVSFSSSTTSIRVFGTSACRGFSSEMTIDSVLGIGFLDDPIKATAAMAEECKAKGTITFRTTDGRKPSVICTEEMRLQIQAGVSALRMNDDQIDAVLSGTGQVPVRPSHR